MGMDVLHEPGVSKFDTIEVGPRRSKTPPTSYVYPPGEIAAANARYDELTRILDKREKGSLTSTEESRLKELWE